MCVNVSSVVHHYEILLMKGDIKNSEFGTNTFYICIILFKDKYVMLVTDNPFL